MGIRDSRNLKILGRAAWSLANFGLSNVMILSSSLALALAAMGELQSEFGGNGRWSCAPCELLRSLAAQQGRKGTLQLRARKRLTCVFCLS